MELIKIAEKFINHLNSLERMLEFNEVIQEKYKEKHQDKDLSVMELIQLIIDVKTKKVKNEEVDTEEFKIQEEAVNGLKHKGFGKLAYDNIIIELDENGEIYINITSGILRKFFHEELEFHRNMQTDMTQLNNSIIISLVTSLELLIGDLIKDYIIEVDKSDFLNKKSIKFDDLQKIDDVIEAKNLLLDQYIDEFLRGSFQHWLDEIQNKAKINIRTNRTLKESNVIEEINETIQRRHLLIHNDGIVNEFYLTRTQNSDTHLKGAELDTSTDYIIDRIKKFQMFGVILVYLFGKKRYKNSIDDFFGVYNGLLLSLAKEGCSGARYIFAEVAEDSIYNPGSKLIAEINYYLSFKLNGDFESVRSKVESFHVGTLSIEYKMAKNILLDNLEDAFKDFKTFINNISAEEFIFIIDWPIMKYLKTDDRVKQIIQDKLDEMLLNEESDNNEEHSHNHQQTS